jgi:hypothetical protein
MPKNTVSRWMHKSVCTGNISAYHDHVELLVIKFARFAFELNAHRFHILVFSAFVVLVHHALADVHTNDVLAEWSELSRDQA